MTKQNKKKKILFICGGNTCRSPMAKVILEQQLKEKGEPWASMFEIDSAAYDGSNGLGASIYAKEAIKIMFGLDLLAIHKSKALTPTLLNNADLILVMESRMKKNLPSGKTWTIKEYAGGSGDVVDPFGGDIGAYLFCANEVSGLLLSVVTNMDVISKCEKGAEIVKKGQTENRELSHD